MSDIIEAERVAAYYRHRRSFEQLQVELLDKDGLLEALADTVLRRAGPVRAQARADFRAGDLVLADRLGEAAPLARAHALSILRAFPQRPQADRGADPVR